MVALLPHHLLPSLAPKITISLRYHLFQRLVLSPLKLSGHQPIEVWNCIHSHIVTSHFSMEWGHISSNLQIIMALFAAFIINKPCLTGMFSNQMLLPIEQYLNHSHTPTPFNLSYSPIPSILRCLKWQADRPSLLHHRPAADYDDPTLSCAQCPGEAPRSVLPRTVPWRVGHGLRRGLVWFEKARCCGWYIVVLVLGVLHVCIYLEYRCFVVLVSFLA